MFDWVEIPAGKEKVLIGGGKETKVIGIYTINLEMHSKGNFTVTLMGVYVTKGIQDNLFPYARPNGGTISSCATTVRTS